MARSVGTEQAIHPSPQKSTAEKRELGQFFTSPPLADFIASFFHRPLTEWRVVDAGAGGGALTLALVRHVIAQTPRPLSFHVTAYEIDPVALKVLRETLSTCELLCADHQIAFSSEISTDDFISKTCAALEHGFFAPALRTFNAAIVNPPYRKLTVGSPTHRALASVGIDVTNLYAGFLALLARLLEPAAELVAIVPRSFCNGPYFLSFRRDFLARMSLRRLHVFESRTAAFSEDSVLQENIILSADRATSAPATVEISSSHGRFGDAVRTRLLPWNEIVQPSDPQLFIRLPVSEQEHAAIASLATLSGSLRELGLKVSTGKVVDFRVREYLRPNPEADSFPLLYPTHFENGRLAWPKVGSKKPNALAVPATRDDLLVPRGTYVVVRRFSSKEERKRIVASLIVPEALPREADWIGIENHLNYFHCSGRGLERELALGLLAYLNWSVIDAFFRHFNGHTQVNATDLRSLPFPSDSVLRALGRSLPENSPLPPQGELDELVSNFCST